MTRIETRRPAPALVPILYLALAIVPPVPLLAASPTPPNGPGAAPAVRSAPPPTPLERARVLRWHDTWREEAGALDRAFAAAVRSVEAGEDGALRARCVELAGALLDLERPRVLPVPDRAADLHVRRALRHLARAAVTCLTERPYAARHALEQAGDAFGQAHRILRRYRATAAGPGEPVSAPSAPR
jgi:hypothetical protein